MGVNPQPMKFQQTERTRFQALWAASDRIARQMNDQLGTKITALDAARFIAKNWGTLHFDAHTVHDERDLIPITRAPTPEELDNVRG